MSENNFLLLPLTESCSHNWKGIVLVIKLWFLNKMSVNNIGKLAPIYSKSLNNPKCLIAHQLHSAKINASAEHASPPHSYTHHFHKMVCTASPDCRGWRGISWHYVPMAKPRSSTQRCWGSGRAAQVKNTVLFSHGAWANEQRLYSSGDDADTGVSQSQKHYRVCRDYQRLCRTLLNFTSQPSIHTSLFIHIIQVMSMREIFQQVVDPFTSCAPWDSAKACAKAWSHKLWRAATLYMLGEMNFCSAVFHSFYQETMQRADTVQHKN